MYANHAYPLILLKHVLNFQLFTIVSGGDLELQNHPVWRMIRRAVYKNSVAIFTVATRLKFGIERESGYQAIVIPTGADTDYYAPVGSTMDLRQKHNLDKDDFLILTLSNLTERKKIDDVIRAAKTVKGSGNVKMIIAGDGPEKNNLVNLCTELGQDAIFLGYVDESTKRELFNIADAYVLASYQEGMPFSVMEAMSCGCICICTNVGDLPRLIRNSVNGYLVKPRQPAQIASKIEEIMHKSEQQRRTIKENARKTILDGYDFRKLAGDMIEIIENMISSKEPSN